MNGHNVRARKVPHMYAGSGLSKSCGLCLQHYRPIGGTMSKRWGWVCAKCSEAKLTKAAPFTHDDRFQVGPKDAVPVVFGAYEPGIDPMTGRPWK